MGERMIIVDDWLEVEKVVNKASDNGIVLELADFRYIDGEFTVDGMNPYEWLEAMLMD